LQRPGKIALRLRYTEALGYDFCFPSRLTRYDTSRPGAVIFQLNYF